MADGSVFKRCPCKNPTTGKRLGSNCPKLRRAGGAWHPTHGTWAYQLELPTPPGRPRRQLRPVGFATQAQAAEERDKVRALLELAGGDQRLEIQIADLILAERTAKRALPDPDQVATRIRAGVPATVDMTTAKYLTGWLAARRGLAENTQRSYGDHLKKYLIPHLGDIPIQQLQRPHIETMYNNLEQRNKQIVAAKHSHDPAKRATMKGVRPLSAASFTRLHATLHKALADAVTKAHIRVDNPADGVELPDGSRPRPRVWTAARIARWRQTGTRPHPVMVWPPELAGDFLDYAQEHDPELYPVYVLILHRGLRRGEACGLRDEDVDLDPGADTGHLTVIEQITSVGYQPITRKVKSSAGDRVVALGPATVTVLRDYLARRDQWRQACGDDWPDTGLFFVRRDGRPWHPERISRRFDALVARAGLPPIREHDLRHCAATYQRHGGSDLKDVQTTLGHSSIGLTADTYTSVILELQREHAEDSANLIPRGHRDDPSQAA